MKQLKAIGLYVSDISMFILLIGILTLFYLYLPIEWIRCKIKHIPFRYPLDDSGA